MFNINLNYNINQALDPEKWDSDFHATSLHGAMEHLASDIKNIKDSLWKMGKYIKDKSINNNPNNIKDLEGVGKVVWEFLSSIYNSHWDSLYINNTNTTFKNKISSKFTPQVPKNLNINNKGKEAVKPIFISLISPLFWLKHKKKLTSYWSTSKRILTPNRRSLMQMQLLQSNNLAHLLQRTLLKKHWKLRRYFWTSQTRKSNRFTKSSTVQMTKPNQRSSWPLRVPYKNK